LSYGQIFEKTEGVPSAPPPPPNSITAYVLCYAERVVSELRYVCVIGKTYAIECIMTFRCVSLTYPSNRFREGRLSDWEVRVLAAVRRSLPRRNVTPYYGENGRKRTLILLPVHVI